jgi:hypothetical protein
MSYIRWTRGLSTEWEAALWPQWRRIGIWKGRRFQVEAFNTHSRRFGIQPCDRRESDGEFEAAVRCLNVRCLLIPQAAGVFLGRGPRDSGGSLVLDFVVSGSVILLRGCHELWRSCLLDKAVLLRIYALRKAASDML